MQAATEELEETTEELEETTEELEETTEELNMKAGRLSAMKLQRDHLKRCEQQMWRHLEELLCQRKNLREHLEEMKRRTKEEEAHFLQEMSHFNTHFSLHGNTQGAPESQTHTRLLPLQTEAESLHRDVEEMKRRNHHLISLREEKKLLQLQLLGLRSSQRDLDRQLREAEATTRSVRAERSSVRNKPLTDGVCLRLRSELQRLKGSEQQSSGGHRSPSL